MLFLALAVHVDVEYTGQPQYIKVIFKVPRNTLL